MIEEMLIRDISFIRVPQPVHSHVYCKWHPRVSVVDSCLDVEQSLGTVVTKSLWKCFGGMSIIHVLFGSSLPWAHPSPSTWTCTESPAVLFLCLPRGRLASQSSWAREAHSISYKAIRFWRLFLLCVLSFWVCACVCQLRISNYGVSDLTGLQSIWASW